MAKTTFGTVALLVIWIGALATGQAQEYWVPCESSPVVMPNEHLVPYGWSAPAERVYIGQPQCECVPAQPQIVQPKTYQTVNALGFAPYLATTHNGQLALVRVGERTIWVLTGTPDSPQWTPIAFPAGDNKPL